MWSFLTSIISNASVVDWLLLSVAITLLLFYYGTSTYDYFKYRDIPFLKPKYPFFGNMSSALVGLSAFPDMIETLYEKGRGLSIVGLFEFRRPLLMIRDPEVLKIVAVKDFDSFMNHRPVINSSSEPIFTKNLANIRDDRWREVRATLSPAFTTSKIKAMFPLISQCATQMVEYLLDTYAQSVEGRANIPKETDLKDLFSRLANDVIATVAFGVHCDSLKDRENEFYRMGKELTQFTFLRSFIFVGYLIFPRLMEKLDAKLLSPKAVDFFSKLVHETIQEREKKGIYRPDMLQLLMQARKGELQTEKEDAGEDEKIGTWKKKLDDDDLTAQVIIFFFAGFETVSSTLCIVTYTLSFNPDVQRKLQQEIDGVMNDTDGNPAYEDVQGMKYLDAVINETLRLFPTAPATDRESGVDTTLPATASTTAVRVPAGTLISVPIIGIHRDPLYWRDPMTFDPERFSDENKHSIKPFTYLPFGVGPRLCIGQRLALIEIKIALVYLLAKFDLHPSSEGKFPLQFEKGFNLIVKGGFLCNLTPRKSK